MKRYVAVLIAGLLACNPQSESNKTELTKPKPILLTEELANKLINLPLKCAEQEWPNKLNQTLENESDMGTPKSLHPLFYGCFDWHSAVHGYWSMVALIKRYPDLERGTEVLNLLESNITTENVQGEIDYFNRTTSKSFERTYGWAWLLKLAEELHTWEDPLARKLENNLQPLTDLIVQRYMDFLPKLYYPIRTGEHPNTAFGMNFALDYANTVNDQNLKNLLKDRANHFYASDQNCPLTWEPNGFDFLSPCMEEANLMRKVLPKEEFYDWIKGFLPELGNVNFQWEVGIVSDRSDGKLVHLDGLNFSRAWCLRGLTKSDDRFIHLGHIANQHIDYSLPNLAGDAYEGGHWLASFAIYALIKG